MIKTFLLFAAALISAAGSFAAAQTSADAVDGPPPPSGVLFLERSPGAAQAEILFLPDDAATLLAETGGATKRLIVTGAYSSGDRFAPEGFVLRRGDATHPWPQGWDGLLTVGADGRADLHDVAAVSYGGAVYNLRERDERGAFLDRAAADRISAVQSHLLIRDGALDLRPIDGAPRFRRRMLFEMADGRIGVYDTSPRSVTLYEAAGELLDAVGPAMAINLDMGAYDFCEQSRGDATERCGLLSRNGIERLTNLISLTQP